MTTYQQYLGRFYIAEQQIYVENNVPNTATITIPAGYYYITGYTSESTEQLCEKITSLLQAETGFTSATCTFDASTGKVVINNPTVQISLTWINTEIRDILGFSGNRSLSATQTANYGARYTWQPTLPPSDFPVDLQQFWVTGSSSYTGRSKDGQSWALAGNTYRQAEIEYQLLPKEDVIRESSGAPYNVLEHFWQDVCHETQPIRIYPDKTLSASSDIRTGILYSEGEDLATFEEYIDRSVRFYQGLWDVVLPFVEHTPGEVAALSEDIGQRIVWWEWNGEDLSQFGDLVDGSNVTSSSAQVVTYGGIKWIELDVTATSGNMTSSGSILPILANPPSANYGIMADVLSKQAATSGRIGACVATRFDGDETYYSFGPNLRGSSLLKIRKAVAGPTAPVVGVEMGDPDIDANNLGTHIELETIGESVVTAIAGEQQIYYDTSSPITEAGAPAILTSTIDVSGNAINLFRNIRCFVVT